MDNAKKVELLEDAYDRIGIAKTDISDIYGDISSLSDNYEDYWKGVVAEQIYTSCSTGELGKKYLSLIDSIDTTCQEIQQKINQIGYDNIDNFINGVEG